MRTWPDSRAGLNASKILLMTAQCKLATPHSARYTLNLNWLLDRMMFTCLQEVTSRDWDPMITREVEPVTLSLPERLCIKMGTVA